MRTEARQGTVCWGLNISTNIVYLRCDLKSTLKKEEDLLRYMKRDKKVMIVACA